MIVSEFIKCPDCRSENVDQDQYPDHGFYCDASDCWVCNECECQWVEDYD